MNNFTLGFTNSLKRSIGISLIALMFLISAFDEVSAQGYVPFTYTPRLNWNTSAYKSFTFTSSTSGVGSMNLRIKYPKNYDSAAVSTEKFPMIVFLHGKGEAGDDNDYHLIHGGQQHLNAVNNGKFNGFLLYPQHEFQFWTDGTDGNSSFMSPPIQKVIDMIDFLITRYRIDPNRITVHGLSMGGAASWYIANKRPDLFASILPMSNGGLPTQIPNLVNTNIWLFQGDRDVNPEPQAARLQRDRIIAAGGYIRYTEYANVGHGTWNIAYAEPDFFSWITAQSQLNIHVFGEDPTFCLGGSLRLGVVQGLFQYEWSNGITTNVNTVTTPGSYSVRFKRKSTSDWSNWSVPVVVGYRMVTSAVTISANRSTAMPLTGSNVTLSAPEGFSYLWSNNSTARSIQISTPGIFSVRVNQAGRCISNVSELVHVTRGPATSPMVSASNVNATVLSPTAIDITWNDNSNNETFFEIYGSNTSGGNAVYLGRVPAGTTAFSATNLIPNRDYFLRIRAINNTGFATNSTPRYARTLPDLLAPTAPTSLLANNKTETTISLIWGASTDNVGVVGYDILQDGLVIGTSTTNAFIATGLVPNTPYTFAVRARDITGNISPLSNSISQTILFENGLDYKYYEGQYNVIPNFAALLEVRSGKVNNFDISPRDLNNNFGFKFEGYVDIVTAGSYTFFTTSDDGSDLFINGIRVVDNDGLHGPQERSGIISLTTGRHPIIVRFFEAGGGELLNVRWQGPSIAKAIIPNANLFRINNFFDGTSPSVPANLSVATKTLNSIYLKWNASTDNVGVAQYEIFRNGLLVGNSVVNDFEVSGLDTNNNYTFEVSAKDFFGNTSAKSSILTEGLVIDKGTNYKYFEGSWSAVPDFFFGNEKSKGSTTNFSVANRDVNDNFGFRFESVLTIDVAGSYNFYTSSDDGSMLYINDQLVVNNDGLHATQERTGNITLAAGKHYITVDFFDAGGGEYLDVQWDGPGISKGAIPSNKLEKFFSGVDVIAPSQVTNLNGSVSRSSVNLTWTPATDNQKVVSYDIFSNGNFVQTKTGNAFLINGLDFNTVYNFGIVTKDFAGLKSDTARLTISTLGNSAPTFAAIANQSVNIGDSVILVINSTDPENDAIVMLASNLPSFVSAIDNDNGQMTITIKPELTDIGVYSNVSVSSTDDFGASFNQDFSITVNLVDQAPSISNFNDIIVNESSSVSLNISATDVNGDVITLTASGLPSFATFTDNGNGVGVINVNPGFSNSGVYSTGLITASDGVLLSSKAFNIVVNNTNRLPVLAPIGNKFVLAPNVLNLPVSATDADGESMVISISTVATFISVVDNGNGTGNLSITPSNFDAGLYSVDVIITDASGGVTSETFNLTVTGTNFAPQVVAVGNQIVNENSVSTISITATDSNSNDELTLSVSNLPAFASFTDFGNRTGSISLSPGFNNAGVYSNIIVTASDGTLSGTNTFQLTVNNVNRAPSVANILDVTMMAGSVTLINVSASDLDGDALVLSASNLPSFASFTDNGNGTGVITLSPLVSNVGTFSSLSITAADASLSSLAELFNVTVQALNNVPVLNSIGNQTLDENTVLTIGATATDLDGDNIVLTASNLPAFATFTNNGNGTGNIVLAPGSSAFGSYNNVTITANDFKGGIVSTSFAINVNDVNILYRVNCAGVAIAASPIGWSIDNFSNKSIYLDPSSQNATSGSSAWSGVNTTGAPNNIFGQFRTFFSTGTPVMYNFPAANSGEYIVNLFFHSKSVGGVNAANVRKFDVIIENIVTLDDYDIFADAGTAAVRKSFRINVTDGNIDIDLARVLADPIISGIEIIAIVSPNGGARIDNSNQSSGLATEKSKAGIDVTVSPNPFTTNLTVRFNEEIKNRVQLVLVDLLGKTVYQEVQNLTDGSNLVELNLTDDVIVKGVYFLQLTAENGRTQTTKLIKN